MDGAMMTPRSPDTSRGNRSSSKGFTAIGELIVSLGGANRLEVGCIHSPQRHPPKC